MTPEIEKKWEQLAQLDREDNVRHFIDEESTDQTNRAHLLQEYVGEIMDEEDDNQDAAPQPVVAPEVQPDMVPALLPSTPEEAPLPSTPVQQVVAPTPVPKMSEKNRLTDGKIFCCPACGDTFVDEERVMIHLDEKHYEEERKPVRKHDIFFQRAQLYIDMTAAAMENCLTQEEIEKSQQLLKTEMKKPIAQKCTQKLYQLHAKTVQVFIQKYMELQEHAVDMPNNPILTWQKSARATKENENNRTYVEERREAAENFSDSFQNLYYYEYLDPSLTTTNKNDIRSKVEWAAESVRFFDYLTYWFMAECSINKQQVNKYFKEKLAYPEHYWTDLKHYSDKKIQTVPAELPNRNVFTFLSVLGEADNSYHTIDLQQGAYKYSYNTRGHAGLMSERLAATRAQDKSMISQLNSQDTANMGPVDRGQRVSKTFRNQQTAIRSFAKRGNKAGADVSDTRDEDADDDKRRHDDEDEEDLEWLKYVDDIFNDCGYVYARHDASKQRVTFH